MKHVSVNRVLSLLLCLVMIVGCAVELTACANSGDEKDTGTTASTYAEEDTEEVDPFADVDYKDREFRIYTSINAASAGMGNSNYLIEGDPDAGTSMVNDAVVERNAIVADRIGVKLVFTHLDVNYNGVFNDIRTLVAAGTDEFDLVINDIYPFANLSIEGNFRNVLDTDCYAFDFDQPYWYKEYMDDLRLVDDYEYMLAGDYFIDIIRSAHLLLFNKDLYEQHYQTSSNEVYDWVRNYQWTYEKMNEMITDTYVDKNQNGKKDYGDQFGFSILEFWGSSIGFVVSADPGFIERDDDGTPVVVLGENSRASDLVTRMTELAYNDSACVGLTSDGQILSDFTQGLSLICDYQRLGSLENPVFRDMQGAAGVLPLPMLYESDKRYSTAAHDTSELGAILTTNVDLGFTSTVIQVLNRQTAKTLMPRYYGEGLQVQYVSDPNCSDMIAIIHDNFRNAFILAYNNATGSRMLNVFSEAVQAKREFTVAYKSSSRSMPRTLESKIKAFKKANKIS